MKKHVVVFRVDKKTEDVLAIFPLDVADNGHRFVPYYSHFGQRSSGLLDAFVEETVAATHEQYAELLEELVYVSEYERDDLLICDELFYYHVARDDYDDAGKRWFVMIFNDKQDMVDYDSGYLTKAEALESGRRWLIGTYSRMTGEELASDCESLEEA